MNRVANGLFALVLASANAGQAVGQGFQANLPHVKTVRALAQGDCTLRRGDEALAARADVGGSVMFGVLQNYDFNGFATLGDDGVYRLSSEICNADDDGLIDLAYLSDSRATNYVERTMTENDCLIPITGAEEAVVETMVSRFNVGVDLPPTVNDFAKRRAFEAIVVLRERGNIRISSSHLRLVGCD